MSIAWYEGDRWPSLQAIRLTEGSLLKLQALADRFKAEAWDRGLAVLAHGWSANGNVAMDFPYGTSATPGFISYYLTVYAASDGVHTILFESARDFPFLVMREMPEGIIETVWLCGNNPVFTDMVDSFVKWWADATPEQRVTAPKANGRAVLDGVMLYRLGPPRG